METTTYARMCTNEGLGWLPMLDYHTTVRDTTTLVATPWDYCSDVADVGADPGYLYEMQRHPFPRFTDPNVAPVGVGRGGGEGGGG